jgi:hypothetical protein
MRQLKHSHWYIAHSLAYTKLFGSIQGQLIVDYRCGYSVAFSFSQQVLLPSFFPPTSRLCNVHGRKDKMFDVELQSWKTPDTCLE